MNREIKFRVWDNWNKCFLVPWIDNLSFGFKLSLRKSDYHLTLSDVNNDHFVIQQWSGLRDKNGKDIYEGDLIDGEIYDYHSGLRGKITSREVFFQGGSFKIKPMETFQLVSKIEVVGNIFNYVSK